MALLLALLIVVPIVELYVIVEVAGAIGIVPTLLLLLGAAVLGTALLKHEGRGAWRRFNEALAARRVPAREVADGVMIAVGGTLLLAPGFVTDAFGLLLLAPPTRAVIRRGLRGYLGRRFVIVDLAAASSRRPPRHYDHEGTAEEMPAEPPRDGEGGPPRLPG